MTVQIVYGLIETMLSLDIMNKYHNKILLVTGLVLEYYYFIIHTTLKDNCLFRTSQLGKSIFHITNSSSAKLH